jgi:hypothetical protein
MQHCTQYHLYNAVLRENAFLLVQRNRDTSKQMAAWRKVGYCYPSELEWTLCEWDIYVPLVTKGLNILDELQDVYINRFYTLICYSFNQKNVYEE